MKKRIILLSLFVVSNLAMASWWGDLSKGERASVIATGIIATQNRYNNNYEQQPRKERKNLVIRLSSSDSPIVIGKHGKNLDALQLLANTFVSNKGFPYIRVLLDCENYRVRREEALVRLAYETADKVTMYRRSILLEPMNPYERRLIHTTLNDVTDIETKSEGEGVYRRVRVSLRWSILP